jgi:hypothetical protein
MKKEKIQANALIDAINQEVKDEFLRSKIFPTGIKAHWLSI